MSYDQVTAKTVNIQASVAPDVDEKGVKAFTDKFAEKYGLDDAFKYALSEEAKAAVEEARKQRAEISESTVKSHEATQIGGGMDLPSSIEELRMYVLKRLLEVMSDKKIDISEVKDPTAEQIESKPCFSVAGLPAKGDAAVKNPNPDRAPEVTLSISYSKATALHYESEAVSYNAKGIIKTADGQTLNLDVSLNMSREFYAEYGAESIFAGAQARLCDPLVIGYSGDLIDLTDEKFDFDLDADGKLDKISFAAQGSGFLALDKNGDGKINDGSELFGPQSGSGFDELRAYDKDKNGWIDENDDIYSKLRIWTKDKDGNDHLYTLKELDVGAIYLGNVSTKFAYGDSSASANGVAQSTSVFLKDSGGAGIIQHIDLTV
jgi:hypothetical protein